MSISTFMHHGAHRGHLGKTPIPSYAAVGDGHIHFYDIDEENDIGAWYPDGARMIHTISTTQKWRPQIVEALVANREQRRRAVRPQLRPKAPDRPRIVKPSAPATARPRVIAKPTRPQIKVRRGS